jgi:pyruvate dehydrogenase E1 component
MPARSDLAKPLRVASDDAFAAALAGSGERTISTTMAFVTVLTKLLRDATLGARIVPIVADEARTFGMEALFRQVGIYAPHGQLYDPEDRDQLLYYKEARDGQMLEEGISEAGALASWIAAACRCCPSISTTRCSDFSAWAIWSGRLRIRARAGS